MIAAVISVLVGSTTSKINAASVSDLESDYPYIYWLRDYKVLIVSKKALTGQSFGSSTSTTTSIKVMPYPYQTWFESTTKDVLYCMTIASYSRGDAFALTYNPITGWEAEYPSYITSNALGTTPTSYTVAVYIAETQNRYTYSNGVAIPSGFYNAGTTLPDDIPALDNVKDVINDALNATTSATTEANTVQNNIYNTYISYSNGEITEAEFNNAMAEYQTQLEELSNRTGNTLADQIAINNAITYQDVIINQQVNNVSHGLLTIIERVRSHISSYFNDYTNGKKDQSTAISMIKTSINDELLKVVGDYTSTADREAINGTIEYANQLINSIANYADINTDISDAVESSDQEELELLDDMVSVMQTEQIENPMQDQANINLGQTVKSNIEPVLNNKYISGLMALCTTFIIMCIILGTGYKFG